MPFKGLLSYIYMEIFSKHMTLTRAFDWRIFWGNCKTITFHFDSVSRD